MMQSLKEALVTIQFEEVFEKSKSFTRKVKERLVELELDDHFMMDSELQTSHFASRLPGEEVEESRPDSPLQHIRVEISL